MNSACSYGEERLASLLYEDGDETEIIEMRAHLATCAECRAELESYKVPVKIERSLEPLATSRFKLRREPRS